VKNYNSLDLSENNFYTNLFNSHIFTNSSQFLFSFSSLKIGTDSVHRVFSVNSP